MARNTDINLQKQVIYSVYVRAHTEEGTFLSLISDLDRIRALGTDIIWLMPIHPIGVKNRKGSLGCPYANRDYRSVNPEYGTLEDFRKLVDAIHQRGMKCMIDVVYNHTSPDAVLLKEHPEFYYHDEQGNTGNKIGDWSDVIDLDYGEPGLWDYQIQTLCQWAGIVDGFRCDVASFVPVPFWNMARSFVERVHPGFIWLAETVHLSFGNFARREGFFSARDTEVYEAFDLEYEYDVRENFDRYLKGEIVLSQYLDLLNFQEAVYPVNYNKMRFLENHDQPRICANVREESDLDNYTAMLFFLKGTTLLYAGQEFSCTHTPSLFEKEVFERSGRDISGYLRKLSDLKHSALDADDGFCAAADDKNDIALLQRQNETSRKIGVFSLKSKSAEVEVEAPDGIYENLIDCGSVRVKDGKLHCDGKPIVFRFERTNTQKNS
ncbi:MAG: alpha-amylase [Oscillospiraceae bacterium]|nr:alpha-amylase [Oscillospiraceae bacterium]